MRVTPYQKNEQNERQKPTVTRVQDVTVAFYKKKVCYRTVEDDCLPPTRITILTALVRSLIEASQKKISGLNRNKVQFGLRKNELIVALLPPNYLTNRIPFFAC